MYFTSKVRTFLKGENIWCGSLNFSEGSGLRLGLRVGVRVRVSHLLMGMRIRVGPQKDRSMCVLNQFEGTELCDDYVCPPPPRVLLSSCKSLSLSSSPSLPTSLRLPPSTAGGTATLPKRISPDVEIPLNTTVPYSAGGGGEWKRRRDLNASLPSCSGSPTEVLVPLCFRGPTSRNFTAALMRCNITPFPTTCFVRFCLFVFGEHSHC